MIEPHSPTESKSGTWTTREIITTVLTACVVLGLVIHGWFGRSQEARVENSSVVKDEFELRYFEIQCKLLVGLTSDGSEVTGSSSTIAESAIMTVINTSPPDTFAAPSKAQYLAKQAVLSDIVNRPLIMRDRLEDLSKLGAPFESISSELSDALASDSKTELSPELSHVLGWMSKLATTRRKEAMAEAAHLAGRMTYGGAAIGFIAIVGFSTLLVLSFLRITGRMKFRFVTGPLPRFMRIEMFLIYIAVMTGVSFAVGYLGSLGLGISQIALNLIIMASMPILVVMWPVLQGYSFRDIAESLGLNPLPVHKFIRDVLIAPLFYFATWVVLLPLLMIYALTLKIFGVDMAQGAHPVFSWLLQDRDPYMFLKVAFLAVVIAPILEEITFRGALYSWLRSRIKAPTAILLTAFIFAIIHPQGPLGVLPLMGCAIAFGILREWRGSLYAPMIAHACFNGGTMLLFWLATSS